MPFDQTSDTTTAQQPSKLTTPAVNMPEADMPEINMLDMDSQITTSPSLNIATDNQQTVFLDLGQLQSLIEAGGPIIAILICLSLIVVTVSLLKCWQFFRLGLGRYKVIHTALLYWQNKHHDKALKALKGSRNPIARVLETAMSQTRYNTRESIAREETLRIAKRELAHVRSHLKILEVIATLSPLLGLLGTVLGMITAFQKLQGAGSTIDPALLSGGIWEALLTTAAGLIVAIPALVTLNWFEQRIEHFKLIMEDTMTQIFTSDINFTTHTAKQHDSQASSQANKEPTKKSAKEYLSTSDDKNDLTALAT